MTAKVRCDGSQRQRFAIACYTVSNLQFGEFVRATGYTTDAERYGWSFVFEGLLPDDKSAHLPAALRRRRGGCRCRTPIGPSRRDRLDISRPARSSGRACLLERRQGLLPMVGHRLPTEAEWEMAARGGLEQAIFPWGNELTPAGEHRCNIWQGNFPDRNTAEDGFAGTAPVHAFVPNGYGLYNMAGNVWEWCEDYFLASLSPDHRQPRTRFTTSPGPTPLAARRLVPLPRFLLQPLSRRGAQLQHAGQLLRAISDSGLSHQALVFNHGTRQIGKLTSFVNLLITQRTNSICVFEGLNAVYEENEKRSFIKMNAISLALTLGGLTFVIASLLTITVVPKSPVASRTSGG